MKRIKAGVLLLLIISVLSFGCWIHTNKIAPNDPSSTGSQADHTDLGLKPPTFKEKRMTDVMRGLIYDSGFVTVDPAVAAEYANRGDRHAAEAFYQSGRQTLFEVNNRVAAIGAFTKAVIIFSEDPRYYTGLGQALLRKGKTAEALASFRTALRLDGTHFGARYHLARALQMKGKYQEAADAWHRVLDLNPDFGEAHSRLAILYYYAGDRQDALFHVRRAGDLAYEVPPQFRLLLEQKMPKALVTIADNEPDVGPQIRIDTAGSSAHVNETTIASLDPNPLEVVAGWNDTREGYYRTGVALSNDGGQTWTDFLLRPPSGHTAYTEGDPMTCYDNRTGTLWAGGMAWGSNGGVFVARKVPGSNSFEPSVMTYVASDIDKGWMAAGREPSGPQTTRVYLTYNYGCQYSTDMGYTWSSPLSLGSGIGFLPRVGPNGELYVAYWDYGDGVMLRRSFNGGVSFEAPIRIATRMDVWDTQGGDRFPGQFRVPSLNYLAVDPNTGTLYCVYFDTTNTSGGNANVDLYFTQSENQGTSWTTPQVINGDGSPPGDQFWPWIEVDQAGRLHILFFDTRHTVQDDDTLHGMIDAYYTYSDDGGSTWHEYRLTPAPFDSDDLPGSGQFLGDYLGLGVGGSNVYPCYPSTQNGNPDIFSHVISFGDVNSLPVLSGGDVTPAIGYYGTRFEFTVDYFDANGDAPSVIYVNIDGTDYDMTLDTGTAANGSYIETTRDIAVGASHDFYFYAEDGMGGVSRMPATGTLSGPTTYDPELYLTGTPAHGAWMTLEIWGAADALWGSAWSSEPGPFYLPASGLTYDIGPGDLHMAKRLAREPLHLDPFGYGTAEFKIGNQVSSGIKYIQGTTKMNAFWGKTNRDTFEVP